MWVGNKVSSGGEGGSEGGECDDCDRVRRNVIVLGLRRVKITEQVLPRTVAIFELCLRETCQ